MRYYIITNTCNTKVIGPDFPQAWQFTKEYKKKMNNPDAVYAFGKCILKNIFPDFEPDLSGHKLSRKAKITDFASQISVTRLPLMNKKALDLLETFNLGNYRVYPCQLYVRDEPIEHYFLYQIFDAEKYVNVTKSIFSVYYYFKEPHWNYVSGFTSMEHYRNYRFQLHSECRNTEIAPKKLVFNAGCDKSLDLIRLPDFSVYFGIISERLYNAIQEVGLTGLEFTPIEVEFE